MFCKRISNVQDDNILCDNTQNFNNLYASLMISSWMSKTGQKPIRFNLKNHTQIFMGAKSSDFDGIRTRDLWSAGFRN